MQRIGVLGGSFDPIHHGHLAVAHEVAWALALDEVLLVPAGQQPLKARGHAASAEQRLAMVEVACAADALLAASDAEVRRPGPSYTVDTLRMLRAERGSTAEIFFVVGADALAELPRWKEAPALIALCRLAAVGRPGATVDSAALERALPGIGQRLTQTPGPNLELSGSEIRRRLAAGQPVRYQLPDAVLAYIQQQGLYRGGSGLMG